MKSIKTLIALVLIFTITGCSTTEKFTMYAPAGAKIYTPDAPGAVKAEAAHDGKVNIEIPSDMYCGYVLAQLPQSDVKIPVGIDYKSKNHTGTKAAEYAGYTLTSVGLFGSVFGLVGILAANDDTFDLITGIGLGVAGIGAAVGAPAGARLEQTAYDYNFGYVNNQVINIPSLSFKLLNPNAPKANPAEVKQTAPEKRASSRGKASSGKDVAPKPASSKVSNARTDNARKIEGTYLGNGTLMLGKSVDEKYSDIAVILERVDKNHVSVRIIESNEDYFETPLVYEISKDKKGNYVLNIQGLPEAIIKISSKGLLTFNHKKVNIEDTIYTLEITAEKE